MTRHPNPLEQQKLRHWKICPQLPSRSVIFPVEKTQPESLHPLVLIPMSTSHLVNTLRPSPLTPQLPKSQLKGSPQRSPSPSGSMFSSPSYDCTSSPLLSLSLPNLKPQPAKAQLSTLFSSQGPQPQAHSFAPFPSPAPNSQVQAQPSPLNSSHPQLPVPIS